MHVRAVILVGTIVIVLVVSGGYVLALRSVPATCTYPAPIISLPVSLRAAGELEQPLPLVNGNVDATSATEAIQTMYPDIAAPLALPEIREQPLRQSAPPVIVIPFRSQVGTNHVEAVLVFAVSCSNEAYFSTAENWQRGPNAKSPPVSSYIQVSAQQAKDLLHVSSPLRLVYRNNPLNPLWEDPRTGMRTSAR